MRTSTETPTVEQVERAFSDSEIAWGRWYENYKDDELRQEWLRKVTYAKALLRALAR